MELVRCHTGIRLYVRSYFVGSASAAGQTFFPGRLFCLTVQTAAIEILPSSELSVAAEPLPFVSDVASSSRTLSRLTSGDLHRQCCATNSRSCRFYAVAALGSNFKRGVFSWPASSRSKSAASMCIADNVVHARMCYQTKMLTDCNIGVTLQLLAIIAGLILLNTER